jgi:hypothetical protein
MRASSSRIYLFPESLLVKLLPESLLVKDIAVTWEPPRQGHSCYLRTSSSRILLLPESLLVKDIAVLGVLVVHSYYLHSLAFHFTTGHFVILYK